MLGASNTRCVAGPWIGCRIPVLCFCMPFGYCSSLRLPSNALPPVRWPVLWWATRITLCLGRTSTLGRPAQQEQQTPESPPHLLRQDLRTPRGSAAACPPDRQLRLADRRREVGSPRR